MAVPGAHHFAQVVDLSFAERLAVVGATILHGKQAIGRANQADSFSTREEEAGAIYRQGRFHLTNRRKDFYPVHQVVFKGSVFFYLTRTDQQR